MTSRWVTAEEAAKRLKVPVQPLKSWLHGPNRRGYIVARREKFVPVKDEYEWSSLVLVWNMYRPKLKGKR